MTTVIASIRKVVLTILFQLLFIASTFADSPSAIRGILDARDWDIHEHLALQGEWNFYPNELLTPEQCRARQDRPISSFPRLWNENGAPAEIQYGTYRLMVLISRKGQSLSIDIPQMYCSYRLWIDTTLVASNGQVGATKITSIPQWHPQTVEVESTGDTLQLVLQISNFYHFKGGSKDPIFIGTRDRLENQQRIATGSNLMEAIILSLIGLIFLILWFSDQKKVIAYFALLCFTWSIRSMFSNLYLIISLIPDLSWNFMIRVEYCTLYLMMIWSILFLNRLFPLDGNPIAKYLLVGVNVIFFAGTLFFDPVFFTRLLPIYLSFCGFLLIYAVYIVVRAWINEHAGVWFTILSLLLGVLIFAYDMSSYEGLFTYNPLIFSIGYITIFLLMAASLLLHLNIIKGRPRTTILTYNDLYKDSFK